MTTHPKFVGVAILFVIVFWLGVLAVVGNATAQSVVACRDRSGAIVPCANDGASGSYNTGVCNVICQGIRGILGIATPEEPSGPTPAQIEAARRAQIEGELRRKEQRRQQTEAAFSADRDAAAQELKGASNDSGLKGGDGSALHQLPSTNLSSTAAASLDGTAAKAESNCGFDDTFQCPTATPVKVPNISGTQLPPLVALWNSIPPAARNDEQIKQNVALITKLEGRKSEKKLALADIQKQIDQGGDVALLAAKKGTLENDLKRIDKDEQKAADQIGKRMADRHLTWGEGN